MIKVNEIQITVSYTVELGDLEIPNKALLQLQSITRTWSNEADHDESKYEDAIRWIVDNIKQRDQSKATYTIETLDIKK